LILSDQENVMSSVQTARSFDTWFVLFLAFAGSGVLFVIVLAWPEIVRSVPEESQWPQLPEGEPARIPDLTGLEFKISPVLPNKDPKTGFVTGGSNPTALIERLSEINGQPINELEKWLKQEGFLREQDRLLEIMATDNRATEALGVSHQELARHLKVMYKAPDYFQCACYYHNTRFIVKFERYFDSEGCPLGVTGVPMTYVSVKNVDNKQQIRYSLLTMHLIDRYGFYGRKEEKDWVDPQRIVEVFDFLKKKQ
jgi:hypothetical protein